MITVQPKPPILEVPIFSPLYIEYPHHLSPVVHNVLKFDATVILSPGSATLQSI